MFWQVRIGDDVIDDVVGISGADFVIKCSYFIERRSAFFEVHLWITVALLRRVAQPKFPSWDRRGGAKRRGGTSQMRAKRALLIRSLSIRRRRYAPHSFSTTPLASFLGSLPLLSQEGSFEFRPSNSARS